jgi:hypothetical protein
MKAHAPRYPSALLQHDIPSLPFLDQQNRHAAAMTQLAIPGRPDGGSEGKARLIHL